MSSFILLLGIGIALFGFALRSFAHPVIRKLGGATLLIALGLILANVTGSIFLGIALALGWPLMVQPWLAILTQVRPMRLPLRKTLRFKTPPPEEELPALEQLSGEILDTGFQFTNDTGWDWENFTQFFRLFSNVPGRTQARLCVNQMEGIYLYYITLASWTRDGTIWLTTNDIWTSSNDLFSYGLVAHPGSRVNRHIHARSFEDLLESHRQFLESNGVTTADLAELDQDEAMGQIEGEMTNQLRHNLKIGLLEKITEEEVRYSVKGLFYIWAQALKDMLRVV
jgi:hypothetical protein